MAAFGSSDHPVYIKFDDLLLSVYLNAVDPVFFQRHIDQVLESKVPVSAQDVMETFQAYHLERGPGAASSSRALLTDVALVTAVPSTPVHKGALTRSGPRYYGYNGPPGSLGPFVDSQPAFCKLCWAQGFRYNNHLSAACPRPWTKKLAAAAACPPGFDDAPCALVLSTSIEANPFYWDSCSSIMVVKNLSLLYASSRLTTPFRLGGIGTGIMVTHVGQLPFLPPAMRMAYYSAEASANLLSLGQIQRCGGSYRSLPDMKLGVYDADGVLLDSASVMHNNLPIVSPTFYQSSYSSDACVSHVALTTFPSRDDFVDLIDPALAADMTYDEFVSKLDEIEAAWKAYNVECDALVSCASPIPVPSVVAPFPFRDDFVALIDPALAADF